MRILGDNSDGFQNEINIQDSLDFKIYDSLNPNLKHFLQDMFRGYNLRGKRIHAIRAKLTEKPDFYVTIDGVPGGRYVSVKKGSGNSVHQEKLSLFIEFLRSNGASEEIIDDLLRFHYSDGTDNNTGMVRLTAREFAKENPEIVFRLNEYFSEKKFLKLIFYRVLFIGNLPDAPMVDYLYHGDERNGVWASRDEIMDYVNTFSRNESKSVAFGPLTYQCWNKNLERKPNLEDRRDTMQVKWGTLEDTLIEITSRRRDYIATGAYEGEMSERASVITFNRNPHAKTFENYLNTLHYEPNNVLLIRVTTKQMSSLSNQKVNTRADAYAIEILDNRMFDILEDNEFYLDEDILAAYDSSYYKFIEKSGLSIKKDDSVDYTLIKLTPNSFKELFDSYELGYAASVYCQKSSELYLNKTLLTGWKTTIEDLQEYFQSGDITEESLTSSLELCKKLKEEAARRIKQTINNSPYLQAVIFNGKYIYHEPYIAYYFMQNGLISNLKTIPYSVTTGSGRSHGDYSIVLKPKTSLRAS